MIKTEKISKGSVEAGLVFRQQRRFLGKILEESFIIAEYKVNSIVTIKGIKAQYIGRLLQHSPQQISFILRKLNP